MQTVNVVAVITAKPGKRDEIIAEFNKNVPAVHAEDGCIEYGATVDFQTDAGFQTKYGDHAIVVIEKWQSMEHLMAHAKSEHMRTYAKKTKELIADRKIHILRNV